MKGKVIIILLIYISLLYPNSSISQPQANFTSQLSSGQCVCPPIAVSFNNTSTSANKYIWFFGNGNSSTIENPTVIYNTPGNYTVSLIAIDSITNFSDTITFTNYVCILDTPKINFSVNNQSGCEGSSFSFFNQSTTSTGVRNYIWDFGDGNISTLENPIHTYNNPGIYEVDLQITDSGGCSKVKSKANFLTIYQNPIVTISSDRIDACRVPQTINFFANISGSASETYTYLWNFGDGGNSTLQNPSHTYLDTGNFTVSLLVRSSSGCIVNQVYQSTVVIKPFVTDFTVSSNTGCLPHSVNFLVNEELRNKQGVQFLWDFGDSTTSNLRQPTHIYNRVGNYRPKLVTTTSTGCVDSFILSNTIDISSGLVVSFSADDTIDCNIPFTTTFRAGSNVAGYQYFWDFGDGGKAFGSTAQHTYSSSGSYDVKLRILRPDGCRDSLIKIDYIQLLGPRARISHSELTGCIPFTLNLVDNSIGTTAPIESRLWNFGDGTTSTLRNPSKVYNDTGEYVVTLTVTDTNGCVAETSINLSIGEKVTPRFRDTFIIGCNQDLKAVTFVNQVDTIMYPNLRFVWKLSNGQSSFDYNPLFIIRSRPDTLNVTLEVYNKDCFDTLTKREVIIVNAPYADFTITQDKCNEALITVSDGSVSDSVVYIFNDGFTTTQRNFTRQLEFDSFYTITQVAFSNSTGCIDSFTQNITTPDSFNITYTVNDTLNCTPFRPTFRFNSNRPAIVTWEFSNGQTIVGNNARPNFLQPGKYGFRLIGITPDSCVFFLSDTDAVEAIGPRALLTIDEKEKCIPASFRISESSSSNSPFIYRQLFINNTPNRFLTQGEVFDLSFDSTNYNNNRGIVLSLSVMDSTLCLSTFIDTLFPLKPIAQIVKDSVLGCGEINYQFSPDLGIEAGRGNLQFIWRRNNSIVSRDTNYTVNLRNGITSFNLSLEIIDEFGCRDTTSLNFVSPDIRRTQPSFDFSPKTAICPPLLVNFTDLSIRGVYPITNYLWDFGDGTTSTETNPQKLYTRAGDFVTTLFITDEQGCIDSFTSAQKVNIKGPTGTFTPNVENGCTPLLVNFNLNASPNTAEVIWDFGDGSSQTGFNINYLYRLKGSYQPSIILVDSLGCQTAYTYEGRIIVDTGISPTLDYSGLCVNTNIDFIINREYPTDSNLNVSLTFDDGLNYTTRNFTRSFSTPGRKNFRLSVTKDSICIRTIDTFIFIHEIEVSGIIQPQIACTDSLVSFTNTSILPYNYSSILWDFGDGNTSTEENPRHIYSDTGFYTITLTVQDSLGCSSVFQFPNPVEVYQNLPPNGQNINYVTVTSDSSILVNYTPRATRDIAFILVLRGLDKTSLSVIDTIYDFSLNNYTDNNVLTENNSYYYYLQNVNLCNQFSIFDSTQIHRSIVLNTVADTNRVFISWNRYEGWGPIRYIIERLDNRTGLYDTLTVINNPQGETFSYTDNNIVCYQTHSYRIRAVSEFGESIFSYSNISVATPVYIPNVRNTNIRYVTVKDNQLVDVQLDKLDNTHKIVQYVIEKQVQTNIFDEVERLDSSGSLLWEDPNVFTSEQTYSYRVFTIDSCGDSSSASIISTTILLNVDTLDLGRPFLTWTNYEGWQPSNYEIQLLFNNEWQTISTVFGQTLRFLDEITDLNGLPSFCYRIKANGTEDRVSFSNVRCISPPMTLYIPNSFTPNDDEKNESFGAVGLYVAEYSIQIYNRWGQLVFESNSLKNKWDGTFKGKEAMEGAYLFYVYARGTNGQPKAMKGTVTLLR
jgi:gliding motility-associated-like protein